MNPLHEVDVGFSSDVAFMDANGDGYLDAFIGSFDGTIYYLQNDGGG